MSKCCRVGTRSWRRRKYPRRRGPLGFTGRIYADNEVWATKDVADLPLPNDNNEQSYDKLFPSLGTDLLAVAEAGPGNPDYNGGR